VGKSSIRSARVRVGRRVRQAREGAGLTQSELARRTGVQPSAVSQWESPQGTVPSVENLTRIATSTSVKFEWLATGRGPQKDSYTGEAPAVVPEVFATDLFEERVLHLLRTLNSRKRASLLQLLEDFAG
jgi:transcriptional regulator with XRE-family HTH domain